MSFIVTDAYVQVARNFFQNVNKVIPFLDLIFIRLFRHVCNCNFNYILFSNLPWLFGSSRQSPTWPPLYETQSVLHTVRLIAERQAKKL